MLLNDGADITQPCAGLDGMNAQPHAFERDLAQSLGQDRNLVADLEHAAGVAVKTILDHRDVEVDDVAILQDLVARNAMADLVVDRCADGLGVRAVTRRRIVEWGRDATLDVDHVVMAELVERLGGDSYNFV